MRFHLTQQAKQIQDPVKGDAVGILGSNNKAWESVESVVSEEIPLRRDSGCTAHSTKETDPRNPSR